MLKSIKFLRGKSRERVSGGGTSVCSVILRRYSQLEVPWRRIHNVIAHAMSVCVAVGNKIMDTRLPQPAGCGDKYDVYGWCWERGFSLGASKQRSVAVGNKVMDTRLPQPAGCGDKYDGSGWCLKRGLRAFSTFTIKAMSILAFLCLFATAAEAKICFLPDGSCGTSKTTGFKQNPNGSGCMYKSEAEARNGLGACETTYKQNMCYYRRCKTEDNNIFADEASCKKKAKADNLICVSCGGCYKVTPKTCPSGYTAGLTTCAEKAGYTASYSSNGYVGYSVCGKCKYTIKPCESGYTVGLASCPEKQGYTSDYSRNGVSGEQVCGKCDYTAKGCASGYTAGLTSCSERRGYNASYASNGYAGELACGKCSYTAKGCAGGYTAGLTSCSERRGYNASYASNGYSGEKICGKCDYTARTCPDGYSTKYSSVSACGETGSEGWNYASNGYSGEAVCGKCTKKPCPSGYYYWFYSENIKDMFKRPCNTSTRCPADSGYYEYYESPGFGAYVNMCKNYGSWGRVAGRSGDGICFKTGDRPCPSGTIGGPNYKAGEYCEKTYGKNYRYRYRELKNPDGSDMCTGYEHCYECY